MNKIPSSFIPENVWISLLSNATVQLDSTYLVQSVRVAPFLNDNTTMPAEQEAKTIVVQLPLLPVDLAKQRQVLLNAETLHRQLRPALPEQQDYVELMEIMFTEGARMAVLLDNNNRPRTLAVFRTQTTTFHGKRMYVDDLVTDESIRSNGWGSQMLNWLQSIASLEGCEWLDLESGTQRSSAHRFYFRNGLTIQAFSFTKSLK